MLHIRCRAHDLSRKTVGHRQSACPLAQACGSAAPDPTSRPGNLQIHLDSPGKADYQKLVTYRRGFAGLTGRGGAGPQQTSDAVDDHHAEHVAADVWYCLVLTYLVRLLCVPQLTGRGGAGPRRTSGGGRHHERRTYCSRPPAAPPAPASAASALPAPAPPPAQHRPLRMIEPSKAAHILLKAILQAISRSRQQLRSVPSYRKNSSAKAFSIYMGLVLRKNAVRNFQDTRKDGMKMPRPKTWNP